MTASSPVGRTKDAGWEIGVSRTVDVDPLVLWDFVVSAPGAAIWLGPGTALPTEPGRPVGGAGGNEGELRGLRAPERIRLTWRPVGADHETTVQLTVSPAGAGRAVLRLHQERMLDADERARQRDHWRSVIDQLVAAVSETGGEPGAGSVRPGR